MRERNHTALLKEELIEGVFITPPLWKGSVTVPQAPGGSTRYRLVIAEFEEYLVDGQDAYHGPFTKKDRRLVFIEHVETELVSRLDYSLASCSQLAQQPTDILRNSWWLQPLKRQREKPLPSW